MNAGRIREGRERCLEGRRQRSATIAQCGEHRLGHVDLGRDRGLNDVTQRRGKVVITSATMPSVGLTAANAAYERRREVGRRGETRDRGVESRGQGRTAGDQGVGQVGRVQDSFRSFSAAWIASPRLTSMLPKA